MDPIKKTRVQKYVYVITCLNIACELLAEHLECALFECIEKQTSFSSSFVTIFTQTKTPAASITTKEGESTLCPYVYHTHQEKEACVRHFKTKKMGRCKCGMIFAAIQPEKCACGRYKIKPKHQGYCLSLRVTVLTWKTTPVAAIERNKCEKYDC